MLVRMSVGPTAGAVVKCWRLGKGESSDQFVQKAVQEYRSALGLRKTEAVSEADDARTFTVVRHRRSARAREFQDALAEFTDEHYDDWDLGDEIQELAALS